MTIILPSEIEDFNRVLASYGYSNNDFELTSQEDSLPATGGIAPITGTATVKHRVSGKELTYQAGHGTAWVVEFENDLKIEAFDVADFS